MWSYHRFRTVAISIIPIALSHHHHTLHTTLSQSTDEHTLHTLGHSIDEKHTQEYNGTIPSPSSERIIMNWSGTHMCSPRFIYEPSTLQELIILMNHHHETNTSLRPVGSALSPNGIGLPDSNGNMLYMGNIDHMEVDVGNRRIRVGAGCTVNAILKELAKHNLTLENFSSIKDQQIGGWTQVAAHGTGVTLPTVEEMITELTLYSPGIGLVKVSKTLNPWLFSIVKVGLGSLGVIYDMTLSCIPQLILKEETKVMHVNNIQIDHINRLHAYRHVKYLWLPYTQHVVSVFSNPTAVTTGTTAVTTGTTAVTTDTTAVTTDTTAVTTPVSSILSLLSSYTTPSRDIPSRDFPSSDFPSRDFPSRDSPSKDHTSFPQLRDEAIQINPTSTPHIQAINFAELEYWKAMQNYVRIDDSEKILGFDCGGAQLVLEVCFPVGDTSKEATDDVVFVKKLLQIIEDHNIPAPCPIEQRWTASSTSKMSPAYSDNPNEIFCWVGVIMYLPSECTIRDKKRIEDFFRFYTDMLQPLYEEYHAVPHWAKIEVFSADNEMRERKLRQILTRYDLEEFRNVRSVLDPKGVLSNSLVNEVMK